MIAPSSSLCIIPWEKVMVTFWIPIVSSKFETSSTGQSHLLWSPTCMSMGFAKANTRSTYPQDTTSAMHNPSAGWMHAFIARGGSDTPCNRWKQGRRWQNHFEGGIKASHLVRRTRLIGAPVRGGFQPRFPRASENESQNDLAPQARSSMCGAILHSLHER